MTFPGAGETDERCSAPYNSGDLWAREIIFCVVRPPAAAGSGPDGPIGYRPAAHRRLLISAGLLMVEQSEGA